MNRKFSIALAIVGVLVLGVAATDANAQCAVPKGFNTAFSSSGVDSFTVFPADADTTIGGPNLKGRFWQSGARSAANEGTTCPEDRYLVDLGGGSIAVFGALSGDILGTGPCIASACVAGNMTLLLQTRSTNGAKSYFAVGKVSEGANGFDFSTNDPGTNWIAGEAPRPRVTTSGRAGGTVNVNLHFDAPSVYVHGDAATTDESVITGYQLFRVVGNADPGRNPAAWGAAIQTVPATAAGANLSTSVDCTNTAADVFLGTRAVFEGGQFASDDVSQATRVECDPTLAEPRFNKIEKKNPRSTTKTPGSRQ